ncbi:glycosyl hydrolase family 95 catalytic domain-containing protein, partial [Listeria monocytogenes]|uniref:glycosyl hydrolase family 95 catalytic domain-containing protein n=1 Tax=Listeria monocytogenes TaxID=1639 RepID=UPI003FA4C22C
DWDDAAPEPHHRHVSHLYALYPSGQISPDQTPDLARACRVSLEQRGDESTGWATAWRIALWARLGDGERAHRILRF